MLAPVSTQSPLAPDAIHPRDPLPLQNKGSVLQESSLASLRSRPIGLKEAFMQLLDTAFFLAVFPLYVYAFFLTATFSLIALPFLIILAPIVLATRVMRGILHMLLPCVFPPPFQIYDR